MEDLTWKVHMSWLPQDYSFPSVTKSASYASTENAYNASFSNNKNESRKDSNEIVCWYRKKKGHYQGDCQKRKRKEETRRGRADMKMVFVDVSLTTPTRIWSWSFLRTKRSGLRWCMLGKRPTWIQVRLHTWFWTIPYCPWTRHRAATRLERLVATLWKRDVKEHLKFSCPWGRDWSR